MDEKKIKVASGLFWKFSERMGAQTVTFVVSVVLARLLRPEEFGAVALIMVFISLANVLVSNGFGNALIQKLNADNLDFSSVFYFNIVVSIGLYFVIFFTAPAIGVFFEKPVLGKALRILAIRIPIAGINSVQHAYISRTMQFKKFFFSTLGGTIISAIVGIIMAYSGFGIWALVAQYLINAITDTIILWFTARWRPIFAFSLLRMKILFRYGWKLILSGLLDTGYNELRNLIIGKKYSSAELGYYNNGQKIPSIVATNLNDSIGSVLFPVLSQEQNNPELVRAHTRRAIQISSFMLWPVMLGIAACAEIIIKILLTEKWLPAVPFLRIACFTYGLWPIHTSNLEAMKAMGRSDLFLKIEILKKVFGISVLLIAMNYGVMAIASSAILTGIVSTVINSWPNRNILRYSYIEQIRDILPSFLISLFMAILVFQFKWIISNNILLVLCQIIVGAAIYVGGSKLFNNNSMEYVFGYLKRFSKKK